MRELSEIKGKEMCCSAMPERVRQNLYSSKAGIFFLFYQHIDYISNSHAFCCFFLFQKDSLNDRRLNCCDIIDLRAMISELLFCLRFFHQSMREVFHIATHYLFTFVAVEGKGFLHSKI